MKKFNSVTLILVASIFYICRNYTIGLAPNLIVLIIGMMFQGLSYGLFTGVITYYVTYNLDTQDQMSGQTMIGIMTSGIGSTLGNVLGGILQDTIGLNALFTFVYLMTALGAVIIFICKFVSIKVKNNLLLLKDFDTIKMLNEGVVHVLRRGLSTSWRKPGKS